ncbi:MAG: hypothetical protein C5B50_08170 [Verrucomicrobia bacterium]|nr:MAG: hypothetical protein C5B50_08170 [Verrucomicrobiota bacterium]
MNPDLEALLLALEAVIQARRGQEADALEAAFQAKIEAVLARFPGVTRERLIQAVDFAHKQWRHAQDKKPSSMPPRA